MSAGIAALITHDDIRRASDAPDERFATPVLKLLSQAKTKNYETVCLPITTPQWRARWRGMCILPGGQDRDMDALAEQQAEAWRSQPAFQREELTVTRLDEAENVIALASEWLELDAEDDWVRHDSEVALQQEVTYASYLNINTVILPVPRNRAHVASYARAVNACLEASSYTQLSIRLPIYDPLLLSITDSTSGLTLTPSPSHLQLTPSSAPSQDDVPAAAPKVPKILEPSEDELLSSTWEIWDAIRSICDYSPRLSLTLDLTPPLPATEDILSRWNAEPVRYVFLPATTFIANAKGYPVLPKGTQSFIRTIMKFRPTVILAGANTGVHIKGGEAAYSQYVRHMEKTSPAVMAMKTSGTVENFAQGYQDYLQAPLQPLMDNLQSITYQTFEQDPVKYRNYEEAIYRALVDWPSSDKIVICVAGAGRGPLVARCLKAMERSSREATVYAVEKNPSAYVTLQERVQNEWGDKVTLFYGDMRAVELPQKADILVSELLGSFGDNELSPECLDGAMRFLKPEGISIPSSYVSYLAPLSSSKLFNEVRAGKDDKGLETPYVVMFQAVNILSGDGGGTSGRCGPQIQDCWEFEHPRKDIVLDARGLPLTNTHNVRSAKLSFHIPHAGVLHGLAGYFEAILYGGIELSIHPDRKDNSSRDMLSWFPLFFPFKEPLYLPSQSELQVSIWRLTNKRQVWYEWLAEAFLPVPGAGPGATAPRGRHSRAGSFVSPSTSNIGRAPSPMIDAVDLVSVNEAPAKGSEAGARGERLVKIGQTSLHNPGGRSSWIGL